MFKWLSDLRASNFEISNKSISGKMKVRILEKILTFYRTYEVFTRNYSRS
jgi:hypothetical protein